MCGSLASKLKTSSRPMYWITLLLLWTMNLSSQGFEANLTGGFNLSQLEGDNLSGFDKISATGGIGITYLLNKRKSLSVEFLYHPKGSQSRPPSQSLLPRESISLQYLALPMIYRWGEWFNSEESYYRFNIELGTIINRLFDVASTNSFFDDQLDQFNSWDVGLLIGMNYRLNLKFSTTFRLERSLTKIYNIPNSDLRGLQSYLLSIRLNYHL